MLEIGSVIDGKYKILDVIGKGGMSVVYQARNERANKIWAIKEIRKDSTQNYEVVRRNLIAETDMLKKLNHPNLPSIVDVIDRDGTFLIVMDYIQGKPLSDVLKESGAQPQEDVIEWSKQLCDVLGYLHSREPAIIYRDMKPSNVMLKPDNNIALIDFGTAREFKTTSFADTACLGTRGYAAPEQFGGQGQTDARTDIYCLGATMYHLVTGHNPATPPYEMYPIRQWNPLLSSGFEHIILKCTQMNPNDRYQSCAELLYALDNIQYLEEESRKQQKTRWHFFWTSVALTGIMGVAALGFNFANSSVRAQTYQELIDKAEVAIKAYQLDETGDPEKRREYRERIQDAIDCDDTRVEAFCKLLDLYVDVHSPGGTELTYSGISMNNDPDNKEYDQSEFQEFNSIAGQYFVDSNAGKYYNEVFADAVFLELGKNLFLNCDSKTEGRNASLEWLSKAKDYCSKEKKKTATTLYEFASFYSKANSGSTISQTGEIVSDFDYGQYWERLVDAEHMAKAEIGKQDNEEKNIYLVVEICSLTASEIVNHVAKFNAAGVPKSEMLSTIDYLNADISKVENYMETPEQKEKIKDARVSVSLARRAVNDL